MQSRNANVKRKSKPKSSRNRSKNSQRDIPLARTRQSGRRRPKTRVVNENEVIVSGRDLVVPSPQSLPLGSSDVSVFQVVPGNPVYWTGTRVSKIAEQYQLYRPLKFVVHYHPQVAVTNPGLVIYGTLMQDASMAPGELQQVLNTSNGGGIKECYSPFTSRVNMDRSFLQMQSYNVVGDPGTTVNLPFLWYATYTGYAPGAVSASSCPGWVEVEWTFRFSSANPGSANTGLAIYTASEAEMATTATRLAARGLRANLTLPFGIPLGLLKDLARPLLRHVGVLLLNGAESGTFRFGIGKVLTYIASNLLSTRRNSTTTVVRDEDGVDIELSDDTKVVVFMSGLPQPGLMTVPAPEPEPTPILATFPTLVIWCSAFETPFEATEIGTFTHEGHDITIGVFGEYDARLLTIRAVVEGEQEGYVRAKDSAGGVRPIWSGAIGQYEAPAFYPACSAGVWAPFAAYYSSTSVARTIAATNTDADSVVSEGVSDPSPVTRDEVMVGLDETVAQLRHLTALAARIQDELGRLQA